MLTEEQIEAIAEELYRESGEIWEEVRPDRQARLRERISFITEKAIAIERVYAEQDRRSFIAVGKYIGIPFAAGTDVVSEVYNKLDVIMTAFREHSQEIAIAQQIQTLTNQLEKYLANQSGSPIHQRAVGSEAGSTVRDRPLDIANNQGQQQQES